MKRANLKTKPKPQAQLPALVPGSRARFAPSYLEKPPSEYESARGSKSKQASPLETESQDKQSAPATYFCPYCGEKAVWREDSKHIYRGRDYGPVWECANSRCQEENGLAYVGCHKVGPKPWREPLGFLANPSDRAARKTAHRVFDRLWSAKARKGTISRGKARRQAYGWLSDNLGIDVQDCHISHFDHVQCDAVVALCRPWLEGFRYRSKQRYLARREEFLRDLEQRQNRTKPKEESQKKATEEPKS